VARPRFVRSQGPGSSVSGEVVGGRRRPGVGIGERQQELTYLAAIADESRRVHGRRRDRCRFRLAREADRGRALRQRDDAFARDDLFDARKALAVQREDTLRGDRIALQRAQHVAKLRRGELALARDVRRDACHFVADLRERELAQRHGLLGTDVDAGVAQPVGIELARQPRLAARLGQDGALDPGTVIAQLRREPLMRAFPVGEPTRAKLLGDPGAVASAVAEMLPDRSFIGPKEAYVPEALA